MRGISFGGLWRHPEFVKLWAGQTISLFGMTLHNLSEGSRFDLRTLTPKDRDDPRQFPEAAR